LRKRIVYCKQNFRAVPPICVFSKTTALIPKVALQKFSVLATWPWTTALRVRSPKNKHCSLSAAWDRHSSSELLSSCCADWQFWPFPNRLDECTYRENRFERGSISIFEIGCVHTKTRHVLNPGNNVLEAKISNSRLRKFLPN